MSDGDSGSPFLNHDLFTPDSNTSSKAIDPAPFNLYDVPHATITPSYFDATKPPTYSFFNDFYPELAQEPGAGTTSFYPFPTSVPRQRPALTITPPQQFLGESPSGVVLTASTVLEDGFTGSSDGMNFPFSNDSSSFWGPMGASALPAVPSHPQTPGGATSAAYPPSTYHPTSQWGAHVSQPSSGSSYSRADPYGFDTNFISPSITGQNDYPSARDILNSDDWPQSSSSSANAIPASGYGAPAPSPAISLDSYFTPCLPEFPLPPVTDSSGSLLLPDSSYRYETTPTRPTTPISPGNHSSGHSTLLFPPVPRVYRSVNRENERLRQNDLSLPITPARSSRLLEASLIPTPGAAEPSPSPNLGTTTSLPYIPTAPTLRMTDADVVRACQCPKGATKRPSRHWDACPSNPNRPMIRCEYCDKDIPTRRDNLRRHRNKCKVKHSRRK